MGIIGKDFKYKKITNFLTKEEVLLLHNYCITSHILNTESFDTVQNNNGDTYFYGDKVMESLLLTKLNLMEKETGKKLLPTYAFWRMYTKFADLKKHTDRKACEISVTVNIGSSEKNSWPIFIEETSVELSPGDGIIYLGCELEHWRKPFNGDWAAETFLHYVDKDGPKKDEYMDKRKCWGIQK